MHSFVGKKLSLVQWPYRKEKGHFLYINVKALVKNESSTWLIDWLIRVIMSLNHFFLTVLG